VQQESAKEEAKRMFRKYSAELEAVPHVTMTEQKDVDGMTHVFRFREVCFKVGDSWACTLTDHALSYHYIKTRKKLR